MGLPIIGGLIETIIGKGADILDDRQFSGEERAKAELEVQKLGLEAAKLDLEMAMGQVDVNKIEAASEDNFTRRWRPFIGWVCGFGFAYAVIGFSLLSWAWQWMKAVGWLKLDVPAPPNVDKDLLIPVLIGILGLGAMRTVEKTMGTKPPGQNKGVA